MVGAGQSAAEAVAYLHREFPNAEVCSVFSRYGYSPADDSSFANRIFDPEAVDHYFDAPDAVKQRLMDYHRNTNYSVVDIDLIAQLYRTEYQEKVLGTRAAEDDEHDPARRRRGVARTGARAVIQSLVTGEQEFVDTDLVLLATGYDEAAPVLGSLDETCARDERPAVWSSAATTASRRRCVAASTCRAAPSTRTASRRRSCPTSRCAQVRS